MVAPVRWCWCSRPAASVCNSKAAPPSSWGEVPGAGNIRKNDGVAVVQAWQAARRRRLVGVDACPLFPGGPRRGGARLWAALRRLPKHVVLHLVKQESHRYS